uniref:Uncharacterized protein n=1 Tax=Timema poppense TaxID=170557 RepID=A0A7R9D4H0_TIMPO|nr:unnamed protein product [Timema poppensis]
MNDNKPDFTPIRLHTLRLLFRNRILAHYIEEVILKWQPPRSGVGSPVANHNKWRTRHKRCGEFNFSFTTPVATLKNMLPTCDLDQRFSTGVPRRPNRILVSLAPPKPTISLSMADLGGCDGVLTVLEDVDWVMVLVGIKATATARCCGDAATDQRSLSANRKDCTKPRALLLSSIALIPPVTHTTTLIVLRHVFMKADKYRLRCMESLWPGTLAQVSLASKKIEERYEVRPYAKDMLLVTSYAHLGSNGDSAATSSTFISQLHDATIKPVPTATEI